MSMSITHWQISLLFVSAFLLVGALTPLMRRIAISRGILDRPISAHKSHSAPVPYLGGVAIILGISIITYIAIPFTSLPIKNFWLATSLIGPALAMGVIGVWDDIKNLHPLLRFIGQSISGVLVAVILILSSSFGSPTGSISIDVFITVLWIVGICNSINFFDNLDGGAAGTIVVSSIALTYLAISNGQALIGSLAVVVTGACLGFLIWNKSPARIYMGDAGALFLGVLIATLTIRLKPDTGSIVASFATPVLLLAVPILDTSVAVISRLRRRVSPFKGGKDHLSHRLIRSGIPRKNTAFLLWSLSAFFALLAILINSNIPINEFILVVFGCVVWLGLLLKFLSTIDE
jgi:UDP-GlcNAc:undecaprenyl-phosphate GlcNAc-1-phosphate transferase